MTISPNSNFSIFDDPEKSTPEHALSHLETDIFFTYGPLLGSRHSLSYVTLHAEAIQTYESSPGVDYELENIAFLKKSETVTYERNLDLHATFH